MSRNVLLLFIVCIALGAYVYKYEIIDVQKAKKAEAEAKLAREKMDKEVRITLIATGFKSKTGLNGAGEEEELNEQLKARLDRSEKTLTSRMDQISNDFGKLKQQMLEAGIQKTKSSKAEKISRGTAHKLSSDLKKAFSSDKNALCWIGCIHRKDKKISPSVKYVLSKKERQE